MNEFIEWNKDTQTGAGIDYPKKIFLHCNNIQGESEKTEFSDFLIQPVGIWKKQL